MKYKIKPLKIEAIQYKGKNLDEIIKFVGSENVMPIERRPDYILKIKTKEGIKPIFINHYIAKNEDQEILVFDDFSFEAMFISDDR